MGIKVKASKIGRVYAKFEKDSIECLDRIDKVKNSIGNANKPASRADESVSKSWTCIIIVSVWYLVDMFSPQKWLSIEAPLTNFSKIEISSLHSKFVLTQAKHTRMKELQEAFKNRMEMIKEAGEEIRDADLEQQLTVARARLAELQAKKDKIYDLKEQSEAEQLRDFDLKAERWEMDSNPSSD